jgi:hypothetical protein
MRKFNADMSTPTYLGSATRGALRALRVTIARVAGANKTRIGMAILMAVSATACTDATAPGRRMDRDEVETVIPAVTDARRRVASGIADVAVRQQMTITLSNIEIALRADDVESVDKGLSSVSSQLSAYSGRASSDRADVSAVLLVLNRVQKISSPNTAVVILP